MRGRTRSYDEAVRAWPLQAAFRGREQVGLTGHVHLATLRRCERDLIWKGSEMTRPSQTASGP